MAISVKKPHQSKSQIFENCILDDPEIGIISENDHKVGNCLCSLCTCSRHKCAYSSNWSRTKQLKVYSKYHKDFRYKGFNRRREVIEPIPPKKPDPPKRASISLNPNVRPQYRTSYAKEFPDWGPYLFDKISHNEPPIRTVELAFKGSSSYKDSFKRASKKDMEYVKMALFHPKKESIALGINEPLLPSTEYSSNMKKPSKFNVNRRMSSSPNTYRQAKASPFHFNTTMDKFFQNKHSVVKDPRILKCNYIHNKKY